MMKYLLLALVGISQVAFAFTSIPSIGTKIDTGSDLLIVSYNLKNSTDSCQAVTVKFYETEAEMNMDGLFRDKYDDPMPTGVELFWSDDADDFANGSHRLEFDTYDYFDLCGSDFKRRYLQTGFVTVEVASSCSPYRIYSYCSLKSGSRQTGSTSAHISDTAARLYKKAQTKNGVCYSSGQVYGLIAIKLGAINKKTGAVKVSATITPFVGKKQTVSATAVVDEDDGFSCPLRFRDPIGELSLQVGGYEDGLWFEIDGEQDVSAYMGEIGGAFDTSELTFSAKAEDFEAEAGYEVIVGVEDCEQPIYVKNGTKWSFDKAPQLKYKKFREDGETWYELVGLNDEGKPNISALKLTYTAKTGKFTGSFKVYASNECCTGRTPKLKSYTTKVNGVVVDQVGCGVATIKVGRNTYYASITIE